MLRDRLHGLFGLLSLVLIVILIVGCAPAANAPAPVEQSAQKPVENAAPTTPPTATQPAPTATAVPATAALPPTATQAATPTQAGTPTPTAVSGLAAAFGGQTSIKEVTAWCLPVDAAVSYAKDPLNPPTNAKKALIGSTVIMLRNLPSNGCTFVYTFSQAAPAGLKLELYELKGKQPFFTTELTPSTAKPEAASAFLRHAMVVAPPDPGLKLVFVVRDPLGQELHRDQVNLYNWIPGTPKPREPEEKDCGCVINLP